MLVGQVEGIPGELDTATRLSLDEERVVGAYMTAKTTLSAFRHVHTLPKSARARNSTGSELTGDLPDEVGRDVAKRHFGGIWGYKKT